MRMFLLELNPLLPPNDTCDETQGQNWVTECHALKNTLYIFVISTQRVCCNSQGDSLSVYVDESVHLNGVMNR